MVNEIENCKKDILHVIELSKKRRELSKQNNKITQNNLDKELYDYLESLDFETIKVIQTVLYLGREIEILSMDTITEKIYLNYREKMEEQRWGKRELEINQIVGKQTLDIELEEMFRLLQIK